MAWLAGTTKKLIPPYSCHLIIINGMNRLAKGIVDATLIDKIIYKNYVSVSSKGQFSSSIVFSTVVFICKQPSNIVIPNSQIVEWHSRLTYFISKTNQLYFCLKLYFSMIMHRATNRNNVINDNKMMLIHWPTRLPMRTSGCTLSNSFRKCSLLFFIRSR